MISSTATSGASPCCAKRRNPACTCRTPPFRTRPVFRIWLSVFTPDMRLRAGLKCCDLLHPRDGSHDRFRRQAMCLQQLLVAAVAVDEIVLQREAADRAAQA